MLSYFFGVVYLYCSLRIGWFSWHCGMIPSRLIGPFIWSGLLYQLCDRPQLLASTIKGAVSGYFSLLIIYWLYRVTYRRELLTHGDIKIFAGLGAWYGYEDLPQLLLIAVVSYGTLSIILVRDHQQKDPQHLGISLIAAGLIKLFLKCI